MEALDIHLNKEDSIAAQVKRIEKFREERTNAKRKKKREEKLKAKLELQGNLNSDQEQSDANTETETEESCKKVKNKIENNISDQNPEEKKS